MISPFDKIFEESGKDDSIYGKRVEWTSYSNFSVPKVASFLSEGMDTFGIQHHLEESYIQSSSFNIRFTPKNYGCELDVYIFKDDINSNKFLSMWSVTLKMEEGNKKIVRGGRYKKEFDDLIQKLGLEKNKQDKQKQEIATPEKIENSNGQELEDETEKNKSEKRLRDFCIQWVRAGQEELHRGTFEEWASLQGTLYEPWMTKTVVYSYLKNTLLREGVVKKKGREYILAKN